MHRQKSGAAPHGIKHSTSAPISLGACPQRSPQSKKHAPLEASPDAFSRTQTSGTRRFKLPHGIQSQSTAVGNGVLEFDNLNLSYTFFDPCRQPLRSQLLQKMGVDPNSQVEPIRGPIGGCNAGMWIMRSGSQCFVLKLVRTLPAFMGPQRPSESEKFSNLYRDHPEMAKDAGLSFPCKIFHCLGKGGSKTHDLVIMIKVAGVRMSDFIMKKLHGKNVQELLYALNQFGEFLAEFHERYNGLQHGDLTPANAFYDEETGRFTLVDVSDIAPRNPVIQSDVERFTSGLRLLSHFYGPELWIEGKVQFESGYNSFKSNRTRSLRTTVPTSPVPMSPTSRPQSRTRNERVSSYSIRSESRSRTSTIATSTLVEM